MPENKKSVENIIFSVLKNLVQLHLYKLNQKKRNDLKNYIVKYPYTQKYILCNRVVVKLNDSMVIVYIDKLHNSEDLSRLLCEYLSHKDY